jgi:hypothetical protein
MFHRCNFKINKGHSHIQKPKFIFFHIPTMPSLSKQVLEPNPLNQTSHFLPLISLLQVVRPLRDHIKPMKLVLDLDLKTLI